jgi:hypothetical protein
MVAARLEHAEVVRKLAPEVNRLDVRDLYLVVSGIAPLFRARSVHHGRRVLPPQALTSPHRAPRKQGSSEMPGSWSAASSIISRFGVAAAVAFRREDAKVHSSR